MQGEIWACMALVHGGEKKVLKVLKRLKGEDTPAIRTNRGTREEALNQGVCGGFVGLGWRGKKSDRDGAGNAGGAWSGGGMKTQRHFRR